MTISALGINHKTAPVDLREQVAFNAEQLDAARTAISGSHPDTSETDAADG